MRWAFQEEGDLDQRPLLLKVVAVVRLLWMPTTASTLRRTWEGRHRDSGRERWDDDDEFVSFMLPSDDMVPVRRRSRNSWIPFILSARTEELQTRRDRGRKERRRRKRGRKGRGQHRSSRRWVTTHEPSREEWPARTPQGPNTPPACGLITIGFLLNIQKFFFFKKLTRTTIPPCVVIWEQKVISRQSEFAYVLCVFLKKLLTWP